MINTTLNTEKKELIENLLKSRDLIQKNTDAADKLKKLKFKIQYTNIKQVVIVVSIFLVFSASYLTIALYFIYKDMHNTKFFLYNVSTKNFFLLLITLIVILISVSIIIGNYLKKIIVRKRYKRNRKEIDKLNNILDVTYNECDQFTVLPEKYRGVFAVNKITEYLTNLRADNLKESLNLLEEEMHRDKQAKLLSAMVSTQQIIIKQLS